MQDALIEQSLLSKIEDFFIEIESYRSPFAEAIGDTGEIIFPLIRKTSLKAAALSSGFGLLPKKVSLLAVIPEVFFLLKLQSRLVKDIAIILGKESQLTRNSLLYCLFKENNPDMIESLFRMTSVRILTKPISVESIYDLFLYFVKSKSGRYHQKKSTYFTSIITSLSGGTLSFIDTQLVGMTANSLFLSDLQLETSEQNYLK